MPFRPPDSCACVAISSGRRWKEEKDLRLALLMEQIESLSAATGEPGGRRQPDRIRWGMGGLVLGLFAGSILVWLCLPSPSRPPVMRFVIDLPKAAPLAGGADPLAFSADGSQLAYVVQQGEDTQLYVRLLDGDEPRPVPGTKGAFSPFFSPDGAWIGYFDARDAKLKKVKSAGGTPVELCPARFGLGASWCEDGTIVFTPDIFSGLWRIPDAGGKPELLTRLAPREFTHRWPQVLPNGRAAIFTLGTAGATNSASVASVELKTGRRKVILENASDASFTPTGHLFFLRAGNLMAVRFDPARLLVLGEPFLVVKGIGVDPSLWTAHYAIARDGAIAYDLAVEDEDLRSLVWADRRGSVEKLTVNRGAFSYPRLSPDGRQLAVVIRSQTEKSNIWVMEVATGSFKCLTDEGDNLLPVWTPDGKRLTFASDRDGQWHLFEVPVDGAISPVPLHGGENPSVPNAWSRDGNYLVFTEFAPDTGPDIWLLSLQGGANARPVLRTPYAEWGGSISPDGHWLAYTSNDTGLAQVYVLPFPGLGERFQISTAEGREPVWRADGRELFFRYWRGLMAVAIGTEAGFNPETPSLVISGDYEVGSIPVFPDYDAASDGQRFILIPHEEKDRTRIHVDLNWLR
jgi:Tol biopolymer transport system component